MSETFDVGFTINVNGKQLNRRASVPIELMELDSRQDVAAAVDMADLLLEDAYAKLTAELLRQIRALRAGSERRRVALKALEAYPGREVPTIPRGFIISTEA